MALSATLEHQVERARARRQHNLFDSLAIIDALKAFDPFIYLSMNVDAYVPETQVWAKYGSLSVELSSVRTTDECQEGPQL